MSEQREAPAGGPVEEKAVEALAMERYAVSAGDLIGPQREVTLYGYSEDFEGRGFEEDGFYGFYG